MRSTQGPPFSKLLTISVFVHSGRCNEVCEIFREMRMAPGTAHVQGTALDTGHRALDPAYVNAVLCVTLVLAENLVQVG